jgi:hypothetical protein
MEEKAARGEECKVVFLYVETGNTVEEQRLSDEIYHPILNFCKADLLKYNFPQTEEILALKFTDNEWLFLPSFCDLETDKEISQHTDYESNYIHGVRTIMYKKLNVNDKDDFRAKCIVLGLYKNTCPDCAKRNKRKKKRSVILSILFSLFIG